MKTMNDAFHLVSLLIVTLFLAACATSSHVIVGTTRPPISPDQVRIYFKPPARFEEVAVLDASSKNSWAITDQGKTDKAMQRLKEEAAKLGANGILLRGVGDQYGGSVSSGTATATAYGNTATGFGTGMAVPVMHKEASGVAIYVLEEQQADTVPPIPKASTKDRLKELESLRQEGLITQETYEKRRDEILKGL
jgi:hypothetical protein